MNLPRPIADQPHYGRHLGDAGYWEPYVREVLRRVGRRSAEIVPGFVGSNPTFIADDVVVKLLSGGFAGPDGVEAELAAHRLLAGHPEFPVPSIVAHGQLYADDSGWPWPYLVQTRMPGTAWRDAIPEGEATYQLARQVGRLVARLHRLQAPAGKRFRPDWLAEIRGGSVERARRWALLPEHLIGQIDTFLADAAAATVFVHGDLTEDHVLIDEGTLAAIIDWGDAMLADPWYELVPLHFGCFGRRSDLTAAFLDGYGPLPGADLARRLMQAVLSFPFNALVETAHVIDLASFRDFSELGDALFADLAVGT